MHLQQATKEQILSVLNSYKPLFRKIDDLFDNPYLPTQTRIADEAKLFYKEHKTGVQIAATVSVVTLITGVLCILAGIILLKKRSPKA